MQGGLAVLIESGQSGSARGGIEEFSVDLSGGYKINKRLELMLSVRNVFNESARQYSNEPGRLQLFDVYGSLWNFGVKGTF